MSYNTAGAAVMEDSIPVILIVEDDPVAVELLHHQLESLGFSHRVSVSNGDDALAIVRSRPISVVLLDLFMPGLSGTDVLRTIEEEFPHIPVIVLTVDESVDAAVRCMKLGAFDFMTKPVDPNRLRSAIGHALTVRDLESRLTLFGSHRNEHHDVVGPRSPELFDAIVTQSPKMAAIFEYVETIAPSPRSVLITGESGTGKELLARAIHAASGRSGAFVTVNVAGLDDVVFSDTLFGHRRGAYTGADRDRPGLIEKARGGTLFLDEIGDIGMTSQVKLLRLLQEGEYYPLGSDEAIQTDARIVTATNADLVSRQRDGAFRRDLYYRLISHAIHMPPLRERPEDIELLTRRFVGDAAEALHRDIPRFDEDAVALLKGYQFPGNVRELQAIVVDAVTNARGGTVGAATIEDYIRRHGPQTAADDGEASGAATDGAVGGGGAAGAETGKTVTHVGRLWWSGPFPTLDEVSSLLIDEALRRHGGNQSAAARTLGVAQSTISRRVRRSG